MDLHEYQAKQLLTARGVAVPAGAVAESPARARTIAERLLESDVRRFVVKAQIHAGGRALGSLVEHPNKAGITFCCTPEEVEHAASEMLGKTLVTDQTRPEGKRVLKVLVEAAIPVQREFYAAVALDRTKDCPVLLASATGGVSIENAVSASPNRLIKEWIDPLLGLRQFQARRVAAALGFVGGSILTAADFFHSIYRTWWECEAMIVEINPFVQNTGPATQHSIIALDARIAIDDNALFKHPEFESLRDAAEEEPIETEARKHGLDYIKLDGNIACLVNGAGLAMATMDAIKQCGGTPANFLDVGGGASQEQVAAAFKTILTDTNVHAILVNIFGGITDCAVVARGVAAAINQSGVRLPVVVRIEGNNATQGRAMLVEGLSKVIVAHSIEEAARMAVQAAGG
ncbi:MAG: ADP-forming succinate--CoA ligase subunit beta [Verrucomicrobia bacterium]|nr:ADP-forming succinate--CoA ligase subunit beta [Verrucomicrobiota bacterium]